MLQSCIFTYIGFKSESFASLNEFSLFSFSFYYLSKASHFWLISSKLDIDSYSLILCDPSLKSNTVRDSFRPLVPRKEKKAGELCTDANATVETFAQLLNNEHPAYVSIPNRT